MNAAAPIKSLKWASVDEALAEFLATPCSPPGDLFFGDGAWTNESVVEHTLGGIRVVDRASFDAVRLKYEAEAETFEGAFRALGAAARYYWDGFDLACLRDCHSNFAVLELPPWVADAAERSEDDQLVARRSAMFTSLNPAWCTPEVVLKCVRAVDAIGLDPCSNKHSIVRAAREVRLPEDGLAIGWTGHGLVYVNPPYGREIGPWMAKAAREAEAGAEIVALVPARTDTRWWQQHVVPAMSSVCFVRGRLRFLGATAGAPFPSAVLYYGTRPERFRDAFAALGWCL